MLINNPEFRTSACCIIMLLTIIVAKSSASETAAEGHIEDQSTGEMQDWRQPLPTVSIYTTFKSFFLSRSKELAERVIPAQCREGMSTQTRKLRVKNAVLFLGRFGFLEASKSWSIDLIVFLS